MVQQTINLYTWRENEKMIPPVLITQGESDTRTITFRLLDQATTIDLTGKSLSFEYDKPDGFHVSLVCQATENPGECTCTFSGQAAIAPGIVNDTRVMVRSGTDVLEIIGPRLYIAVGVNANAIVSSSEFATLSAYLSDISTYYEQVAAVQAGLTQTNQNVSSLDNELTALQETVTSNKGELDGEIASLQNTVTSNKSELDKEIESLQGDLNTHTGNTEIHVTQADKNKWNAATSPNDYIVEEGTSGIWRYRKWESGLMECWGNSSQTIDIDNIWDANGSLVYGTGQPVLYPFAFTEIPSCLVTQQNYDGLTIQVIRESGTTTQTPTPGLVKIAPTKDGYEMIFAFEAKGKYR